MDKPATKADLDAALDRYQRKLTRRFAIIFGVVIVLFVILMEVVR